MSEWFVVVVCQCSESVVWFFPVGGWMSMTVRAIVRAFYGPCLSDIIDTNNAFQSTFLSPWMLTDARMLTLSIINKATRTRHGWPTAHTRQIDPSAAWASMQCICPSDSFAGESDVSLLYDSFQLLQLAHCWRQLLQVLECGFGVLVVLHLAVHQHAAGLSGHRCAHVLLLVTLGTAIIFVVRLFGAEWVEYALDGEVAGVHGGDPLTHSLLDLLEVCGLVVPNGAPTLFHQLGVGASSTPVGALVVPDFLLLGGDDRNGEAHPVSSAHTTDAMEELVGVVGQRQHHQEGQLPDVDAPRRHVGGNQETHITCLEVREVPLSFLLVPHAGQHHTRIGVLLARLSLACESPAASERVEEFLEVVAVDVGAAEDQTTLHLERISKLHQHLWLHLFDLL
mmetsp:Transcript_2010/g.4454  ORF Transcript_2010/g.4454 Transcript_2010/m.4454 type:complete len:395 (-) Transcript_2010:1530-2714(-)